MGDTIQRAPRPRAGVIALVSVLMLTWSTAAFADVLTNTLDNTIDGTLEVATLAVDATSTTVGVRLTDVDCAKLPGSCNSQSYDDPSTPEVETLTDTLKGCNIPSANHFATFDIVVTKTAGTGDAPAVTGPTGTTSVSFNKCYETLNLTVTRAANAAIGDSSKVVLAFNPLTSSNPNDTFPRSWYDFPASFVVNVVAGGGGGGSTDCGQPAAPAWATHILKANALKKKTMLSGERTGEYVSSVARTMTQGAVFLGIPKADQGAYSNAVRTFLEAGAGLRPLGPLMMPSGTPPWPCQTIA